MNIKIARNDLLLMLNLVTSVVEKRQTLPILANIFFNLSDGELTLVGTDLEVEMSVKIKDVVGDNGSFTTSSRKILDIARNLPENADISMKVDSGKMLITSARSRYTLKTLEATEFPRLETTNWEERFKINQLSLKSLLDKTAFSMGVRDVRYYLNGVLFELSENRLRTIATDGHRLAQAEADIRLESKAGRELIVPRKAIAEMSRFLDSEDNQEVTLEINKNHLKLTKGETILITKLIDGKFPEFKEVLETEPNISLAVNRTEFIETMTRVAILTSDQFMGVKITLEPGIMRITTKTPEQEEAVEELEIDYNEEEIKAGYNVNYLINIARVIETENICLFFQGSDGICIIKQPEDDRSTWLVMPLRL